ncbi:hypothetical protein [Thalassotalea mangrovi]|uniref:7-cyano-7-deazaguanine synthase n=1 Tax=Thalassotalea mangrovi TaxID=2572245 RepID=A0A4U1B525_9GAMM|nr:hypothetical protein [Thalassotalea mangrovi]TKB45474.1 hypothetical protein E8M12_08640 [Thalassotalea mangrovi]
MRISDIQVSKTTHGYLLTGQCNDFELYFQCPDAIKPRLCADPFITASLLSAMYLNEDIVIDDDWLVSPKLLQNLDKIQDIFTRWEKYLGYKLHKVAIRGGILQEAETHFDKVVSFFSGGVDGSHTFLTNKDDIDALLFVKGIDMQLDNDELFAQASAANQQYLQKYNKPLLNIVSNVRFLGHHFGVKWGACCGGGLSSIALAAGVKKCLIASGSSYDYIYPSGTNYISDHLWSNAGTKIVHDGAQTSRLDKIRLLAQDKDSLNILRVCWHDDGYNCGKCEKCLRTMASLRALGLRVDTFPELTDDLALQQLAKVRLYDIHDYQFLLENIEQAQRIDDQVLLKALRKIQTDFERRRLLREIDKALFNGRIQAVKQGLGNWRKSTRINATSG